MWRIICKQQSRLDEQIGASGFQNKNIKIFFIIKLKLREKMLRNILATAAKHACRSTTRTQLSRALSSGAGTKATTGSSSGVKQSPNQQEEFCPPLEVNIIDYEDPDYLPVPEYPARPNEPLGTRKQRLLYQSRKRGMLENDLLLSTFAARYLQGFDAEQTAQYDQLINGVSNDWDIYYWATDTKPVPEQYDTPVFRLLKQHVSNVEKEPRLRQPDVFGNEV